ncbi:MAG: gluconate 2-dehydrogenase subunit 3 family protein [Candidatus Acidiferrum sp.]
MPRRQFAGFGPVGVDGVPGGREPGMMHRRDLLRLLSAAAVTPLLPAEPSLLLRQAQPAPGYTLRTFTPHQNDTIVAMIDLIIPETDTPGAKAARVNEFMDVILTDWATTEEKTRFLSGLDDADAQSDALFGKEFVNAAILQQTTLLQALDDSIDWIHGPVPEKTDTPPDRPFIQLKGEFFRSFKLMTIHGYYTSEIGMTQELKLEIIPGAYHGCAPVAPGKKA